MFKLGSLFRKKCGWHTCCFLGCCLSCFLSCFSIKAQTRGCATEHRLHLDEIRNPSRYARVKQFESLLNDPNVSNQRLAELDSSQGPLITIPVVVHIIHNDKSSRPDLKKSTNISDDQVFSQMRVLNEDFRRKFNTNGYNDMAIGADVNIEFCLASTDPNGKPTTGINRVYNPKVLWELDDEMEFKALSDWPSDQYLNIWVLNLDVQRELGYATYPTGSDLSDLSSYYYDDMLDGIVMNYQVFGTVGTATYPYNLGRTTTHEIGHWLGLRHIWGDAYCGNDYVADTPLDEGPNQDNDCIDFSLCKNIRVADLTNDYMDYSPDRCMNIFTLGQKQRMLTALMTSPRRKALFQSQGCSGVHSNELRMRVYPVPAINQVKFEFYGEQTGPVQLEWYSSMGIQLRDETVEFDYQQVYVHDLSLMAPGVYIVKVSSGTLKKTVKVIVEH